MLGRRKTNAKNGGEKAPAKSAAKSAAKSKSPAQPAGTKPHKCLGEMLLETGLVNQEQLDEAVGIQDKDGGFLGQILVQLGYVTQETVASCLVKQCKIPHLSLMDYDISSAVLELIPQEVCKQYNLLPIDKLGRILTVAMVDPLDIDALTALRKACPELRIKPILCNWAHFDEVSRKVFQSSGEEKVSDSSEITAESLGLAGRAGIPKAAPVSEAPPEEVVAPEVVEEGMVEEVIEEVDIPIEEVASPAPDPFLSNPVPLATEAPPAQPAVSGADLAEAMRDSIRDAMKEVVAAIQPAAAVPPPTPEPEPAPAAEPASAPEGGINSQDLAAALKEVLQEPLAQLTQQVQALSSPPQQAAAAPALDSGALTDAIRETVQEMMNANQQAQAAQSQQLNKITEATLQSVQQATSLMESKAEAREAEDQLEAEAHAAEHSLLPSVADFGELAQQEGGEAASDDRISASLASDMPVSSNRFENFVTGPNNEFTLKLCQAVAAKPGGEYNPLFIYGNVGNGKTHLLSAVGNSIRSEFPNMRVGYVTASRFSERLNEALRKNLVDLFREGYAQWDVLILDDIQFLNQRPEAQEEFFHIFNVLFQAGRQIIIASDKTPDQLGLLEDRLVSRFASGVVAELKSPDWDARLKILHQCVKHSTVPVSEEVIAHIAMRVKNDVRKMTGALRKVVAYAELVQGEVTCEMAEEILQHLGSEDAA